MHRAPCLSSLKLVHTIDVNAHFRIVLLKKLQFIKNKIIIIISLYYGPWIWKKLITWSLVPSTILSTSNCVAWGLLDYQHSSWIINLVNLACKPLSHCVLCNILLSVVASKAWQVTPRNGTGSCTPILNLGILRFTCLLGWVVTDFLCILFLAPWLALRFSAQQLNDMHGVLFWSAYSFFLAFVIKLSLHMSALPSDPRRLLPVNMPDGGEKWWVKEQPSRVRSHQIVLHKTNLKATIAPNAVECFHSGGKGGEGRP